MSDIDNLEEIQGSITCWRCGHTGATLYKGQAANGSWQIIAKCNYCGNTCPIKGRPFIPHDGIPIHMLPIEEREWVGQKQCSVHGCHEAAFGEDHHWAPRALFPSSDEWSADMWPTANLCKFHHDLWHQRVTPSLCGKNGNGRE